MHTSNTENREQPIMSNTKQQIEEMLNKVSEYNKLSGKGHGDLKDNCYICGISPSGLIEAIDRLVTEAILEKLKSICQDNWQCFIPEKYMLDQIKELQFQLTNKDTK